MRKLFIFMALCIAHMTAAQPAGDTTFRTLGIADGLRSNSVTCLLADSRGYLWIGSYQGINRYDGHQVKTRFPESSDPQLREVFGQTITALEEDVEGNPKWTVGVASSVGGVYDAARMQAMTLAKAELAALLSTNLTQKFEVGVNNESLPHAEAESKAKAIMAAKALSIDQKLGNPRVLFDAYRELPNGNVEVTLRVAVAQKKMDDILGELITASNDITN
jgi:ligand-binding sensor domain-containing protein